MFGLLSPSIKDAKYCRAYCHLCQSHRQHAGLALLPSHSYESVLLYFLSVDAGIVSLGDKAPVACCRLAKRVAPLTAADKAVSRFCSAFSTLLAYIKLTDDLHDGHAVRSRIALGILRSRFEAAFSFFQGLDADFKMRVESILASHAEVEAGPPLRNLAEFLRPTADGFGYVFSLLASCWGRIEHADALERIGRAVGSGIVAFDAAHDYSEDRRLGRYNPLTSELLAPLAVDTAKGSFAEAASLASAAFGESSHAAALLRSVDETITLDITKQALKIPARFDPSMTEQCATANALGCMPIPVVAETSNQDNGGLILLAMAGGAVWLINHFCKSQCGCVNRTTRRTRSGEVIDEEKGPCGC